MRRFRKWFPYIAGTILFAMSLYILYRGFLIAGENGYGKSSFLAGLPAKVEEMAVDTFIGLMTFETETELVQGTEKSFGQLVLDGLFPSEENSKEEIVTEAEIEKTEETQEETQVLQVSLPVSETVREAHPLPWGQMQDFSFLLNQYFILDASTSIDETLLDVELLMGKDLKLTVTKSGPEILIYHTHSQEAFVDSRAGVLEDTIVGVGGYLKKILEEQYGFKVIHHQKVYDMEDGMSERSKAYDRAAEDVEEILAAYPSIAVVIDLHRDGVDGKKFVTEINGKPTAMIMFYNGLSYSAKSGPIEYLPNPYIADNLAFSFQLQMKAAQYYPGFTRNIYLTSLRYNQHLSSRYLLIESGTQLNTVEEQYNAMEPLADILNQVLRGE